MGDTRIDSFQFTGMPWRESIEDRAPVKPDVLQERAWRTHRICHRDLILEVRRCWTYDYSQLDLGAIAPIIVHNG